MNKLYISITLFCVFIITNLVNAQDIQKDELFFDGPNIFYGNDSLIIKYAEDSTAYVYKVKMKDNTLFNGFRKDSNIVYCIPTNFKNKPDIYPENRKIFVVSDLHGQYDIFQKLLLNNSVIDSNNTWTWGKGHLVINGDNFDKGSNVHECLWLIYKLEQQAKKEGGLVHFLLGNHEVKALRGDLKYVKEHYFTLAEILSLNVPDLYLEDTFWGRWLRSKNIITQIGELLFVHGGIHPDIITKNYSISDINNIMSENIDLSLKEIKMDTTLSFLFRKDGPIRFRGFFYPDSLPEISKDQLTKILDHFDVERIIVGHTTHEHIISTFDNHVIGVDGGINRGIEGEGLLINNKKYFRADIGGHLIQLF
jgi:hypothetical protein